MRYDYDDPYKILAHYIMGLYRPTDVIRILNEDGYIANLIRKEMRQADIGGHFLDCIIEDILSKKKRMEYVKQLDTLSEYYYKELDVARLRNEIRLALLEAGIVLPDYSTGGKDSSAVT